MDCTVQKKDDNTWMLSQIEGLNLVSPSPFAERPLQVPLFQSTLVRVLGTGETIRSAKGRTDSNKDNRVIPVMQRFVVADDCWMLILLFLLLSMLPSRLWRLLDWMGCCMLASMTNNRSQKSLVKRWTSLHPNAGRFFPVSCNNRWT